MNTRYLKRILQQVQLRVSMGPEARTRTLGACLSAGAAEPWRNGFSTTRIGLKAARHGSLPTLSGPAALREAAMLFGFVRRSWANSPRIRGLKAAGRTTRRIAHELTVQVPNSVWDTVAVSMWPKRCGDLWAGKRP